MERDILRELSYERIHCKLKLRQVSSRVALLTISATDAEEFGDAPMLALSEWLACRDPIELFIDARDAPRCID
jgi:hypothetical protein